MSSEAPATPFTTTVDSVKHVPSDAPADALGTSPDARRASLQLESPPLEEATPGSPGTKRVSRDCSAGYQRWGSSAQCLSSEDRASPESDANAEGLMESLEKPVKVTRTEGSGSRPTSEERVAAGTDDVEAEAEEASLFPGRPSTTATKAAAVTMAAASPRTVRPPPAFHFPRVTAAPPTTRGVFTRLHSIAQLATVISGGKLWRGTALTTAASPAGVKRSAEGEAVAAVSLSHAAPLPPRYCPPPVVFAGAAGATATPRAPTSSPSPSTAATTDANAALRLRKGETVIILLHRGRESVAGLVNSYTEYLSQMRVFALDLSALPPQEYEDDDVDTGAIDAVVDPEDPSSKAALGCETPSAPAPQAGEEEVEEEALFVAGPAVMDTQRQLQQRGGAGRPFPRDPLAAQTVSGPFGMKFGGLASELSDQLNEVAEMVVRKVSRLLRVETVLNPNYFHGGVQDSADVGGDGTHGEAAGSTVAPLSLPAMIVWRAGGAEPEDYSPYLPCSYTDGSTPSLSQQQQQFSEFSKAFAAKLSTQTQTQADLRASQQPHPPPSSSTTSPSTRRQHYRDFGDYLRANGGALVAKQVNKVDYVHSLSLYTPVYTVAHLYKHIIDTAKAAILAKFQRTEELMFRSSFAPPVATPAGSDGQEAAEAERVQGFFRLLDRENVKSRTLLYLGASWCPPCMRIVAEMPLFIKDNFTIPDAVIGHLDFASASEVATTAATAATVSSSPYRNTVVTNSTRNNESKSLHVFAKSDMDLAHPIFGLFDVNVIPVFLVIDNIKLFELERRLLRERAEAGARGLPFSVQAHERAMGDAIRGAELGRLQNSQRDLINVFVEKHCTSLSFEEDF